MVGGGVLGFVSGLGFWWTSLLSMMPMMLSMLVYYLYAPYWKVRKVPGPPLVPLLGHLPLLAKHGPDVFVALANEYGPIFRFHIGKQPLVVVAEPELCRKVGAGKLFMHMMNRNVRSPTSGSPLHEQGLFLSRDMRWTAMRNTVTPLYQAHRVATLIPAMQTYVDFLSETISSAAASGSLVDISELSLRMSIDVIGKTAFGIDYNLLRTTDRRAGDLEEEEASRTFMEHYRSSFGALKMDLSSSASTIAGLFFPFLQSPLRRLLRRIPGTMDWRMHRGNEKLCELIDEAISRSFSPPPEKEREEEEDHHHHHHHRRHDDDWERDDDDDLISAAAGAREAFGGDVGRVRAVAFEHLLAGTKTTAFTLTMSVHLISRHPEVEEKLLTEIDGSDGPPSANDLRCKFPYVDQVIKEVMRLNTVSPLVSRETSEEVDIGGYILPKGTWVWLAIGVLANDPEQFPEPEEFRPERFDPGSDEERRRHPCAHIPFGIGPRACVGRRFALQEIKLALIHLYRNFVFRLPTSPMSSSGGGTESSTSSRRPEFEFGLVLGFKHPVKLLAIKRR